MVYSCEPERRHSAILRIAHAPRRARPTTRKRCLVMMLWLNPDLIPINPIIGQIGVQAKLFRGDMEFL